MSTEAKSELERLRETQRELVWLLMECSNHLQEHHGFTAGTGLDGAMVDRIAQAIAKTGLTDMQWIKRILRHYGPERFKAIRAQLKRAP